MRMTAPIRPSSTAVMLLFADVAETHWLRRKSALFCFWGI